MNSLSGRLLASFGANSLGRLTVTLIQILSVPVFLSHWGANLYGEWLLLNTIPSYFAMSDLGFGAVAGNEMTMLMATRRIDEALEVFQSVWVITTLISGTAGFLLLAGVWFVPIDKLLHIHTMRIAEIQVVVLLLVLSTLLGMQETLFQAAFRSDGKYAYGTAMKSFMVSVAFTAIFIAAFLGASPTLVALVYFLAYSAGTVTLWFLLKHQIPWIQFGARYASWEAIRRLVMPATSYMLIPITNVISLQGSLIVIGHILGPVSVVVFNTARTISRSAYQVMNLINNSVWPEVSRAFGEGNIALARRLHRRACQLSVSLCLCMSCVVFFFGGPIWKLWTVGKVATDQVLLNIMLLQLLVSSLWFTSSVVPLAINKHQEMARVVFGSTILSLIGGALAVIFTPLGLRGMALGLVLGDFLSATYVLRDSLLLVEDNLWDFLKSMYTMPRFRRRYVSRSLSDGDRRFL